MGDVIYPTPQRIAKAGDQYQAPEKSQSAKRPYARATPALDWLHQRGWISEQQFQAGDRLRHYHAGMHRPVGLVSSYGDRRASMTPVSQESSQVTVDWPVYCGDKVREARHAVADQRTWEIVMAVVADDLTLAEAGDRIGRSMWTARRLLRLGLQSLADADYTRWRPAGS